MDILAAAFFVIAGAWLLVALLYSTLVLLFLRLRAQGELGNVYEEDFGRWYLFGRPTATTTTRPTAGSCYIPLGCIFRRYIVHLQYESSSEAPPVRFMTREERRLAMETILIKRKKTKRAPLQKREKDIEQGLSDDDDDDSSRAICSICLSSYDIATSTYNNSNEGNVVAVTTCSHVFHQDCLMDWLQRQNNTACPCCRCEMVAEAEVWTLVEKNRKRKRRQAKARRKQQQQPMPMEHSTTGNSDDDDNHDDSDDDELHPDYHRAIAELETTRRWSSRRSSSQTTSETTGVTSPQSTAVVAPERLEV
jgi:hypothetical protein